MWEESQDALERARRAVEPLRAELDPEDVARCRPLAWSEQLSGLPVLNLDDVSAIPFLVDIAGVEEYQHRARLRARDGDLFATATPQNESYERYCRTRLRMGNVESILAVGGSNALTVAEACAQGTVLDRISTRARAAGGLVIHPYMGIEAVWELGRRVAEAADARVGVLAPPPDVTWIANDKGAFSRLVERVLDPGFLVETRAAADVAELAANLDELARRHRRVALKRLRCASAMGNWVVTSKRVVGMERSDLERAVAEFLERTEWDGREQVQAVAWEETDLSPSTQLWIPPPDSGPPRLDGIYEQILLGRRRIFIGSRPSGLPDEVEQRLASASIRVAAGLQALGYVGRCSFDFLVVGDPSGDCEIRFTECNGRWGGTSTPMALLDRLLQRPPDRPRPPYRAQDFVHRGLVGADFADVLAAVGDQLFDPATGRGRFVFYNVGPLVHFGKLDVIAIGDSQPAAETALEEDLPRLLGLS